LYASRSEIKVISGACRLRLRPQGFATSPSWRNQK
jgi:hypothetical protein